MKVMVIKPTGGAFNFITLGFINAFKDIGIEAVYWDGSPQQIINYKPDLVINASAWKKEIPKQIRGSLKLAIHVNPYSQNRLQLVHGNDINEPQGTINWVLSQKPDVVFGYGYKDDAEKYWGYWASKHGIQFIGLPCAGDVKEYYPSNSQPNDLVYFGGRWSFKAHKLDKWLLPVVDSIGMEIKGWGGWEGIKGYSGKIPENDSGRKFLASSKVCPCICEPHTSIYGIDIPERVFKVSLCGSLPIMDFVPGFNRYYETYIMAKDPSEYLEIIKKYAKDTKYEEERKKLTNIIRKETLRNHTYHNRMKDLCKNLGFNDIVKKFEDKINNFN
jgi:hypothetical protein